MGSKITKYACLAFLFLKIYFTFNYMYGVGWVYACECRWAWRPEAVGPLELKSQVFVSYPTCMLGSSAKAVHVLNH